MEREIPFKIDRKSGLPIHLQLKRNVSYLISSGYWKKGQKLPTERQLAATLGVSRNTVSLAYRQLENEGLITSRQGRGTFVAEADDLLRMENKRERLARIIDVAIEDTLSLGLSLEEFVAMAGNRVEQRHQMLQEVKIAFLECNKEQLDYFAREIEFGTGVRVMPVLIDDLDSGTESAGVVEAADLIVTTFFHLDEVRSMFPERQGSILGIALDPVIESIVKIARLPHGAKVLLVCLSEAFAERVMKSMDLAGIKELEVQVHTGKDPLSLERKLEGKKAVIVSPGRLKEVSSMVKKGTQIIEFIYKPDAGSVNLLRSSVLEHRNRNPK
ncbi:MAG TPA: GntR family transcriptional regulator [Firmicutes bacterium]|nr:GntR family transcriptional regulator [Bacillota bacterium]